MRSAQPRSRLSFNVKLRIPPQNLAMPLALGAG
jgi:hypothetical protein